MTPVTPELARCLDGAGPKATDDTGSRLTVSSTPGAGRSEGCRKARTHDSGSAGGLTFDRGSRLERAREALERDGWSGLVVTPGPTLLYLTGITASPSERLLACVLPAAGDPLVVAPAFERERIEGQAALPLEIAVWSESQDPFAIASSLLGGERWLLDPLAPFWVAAGLEDHGVHLRSGGPLCAALRRRKEPAEIDALRRAQELTRATLSAAASRLAPGITERELVEEILRSFRTAGAEGWALVQFGEGSAVPHGEAGVRRLEEERAVLVDLGAIVQGYHADLTRSWWFGGRRPERYREVASAVAEAHAEAGALARAGTRAQDLDRAARRRLESRGLAELFLHRLGHGVGLDIHEEPYLVEGNEAVLEAGNVFTIEPGVYLRGEFGVRHEDVWVLTEAGAEKL